jgi:LysR family nitrogen assimilation transcriptional regulator
MSDPATSPVWPMSIERRPSSTAARGRLTARVDAFEFKELRYFVSLARTRNYSATAREFAVTQSTITRNIRKLEDTLGAQLLIRHGRGAVPTAVGSKLVSRLEAVRRLLMSVTVEEHTDALARSGSLSLALSPEVNSVVAPKLLGLCRAHRNPAGFEIREVSSVVLEELILNHGADLAIVQNATSSDQMCVRPILSEKLGLVTAPRHFQEYESRPLRLTDLAGLPLILPTQQHANRTRLDKLAYQRGVRLNVTLETDSVSLAKALVRNGFGYTVLSRMAVQEELARGALVFRDIEYPPLICRHGVAFRHDLADAAIVAAASLIYETTVSLVEAGVWPGIHKVHPYGSTMG